MKKITLRLFAAASALLLAGGLNSCNDFLTVNPKSDHPDYMLFTSERGFQDALVGIYTILREVNYCPGDSPVFGGFQKPNDSNGLIELLSGFWKIDGRWNEMESQVYIHDYSGTKTKENIHSYFINQYKVVANANQILRWIDDADQDFMSKEGRSYNIIKGEALAVKAFVLFDLIRTFGPSPADINKHSQLFIPYPDDLQVESYPAETYADFIARLIVDVTEAEQHLEKFDPIMTNSIASLASYGESWLRSRHLRMNYYATCALKARILLWAGQATEAKKYADIVINAEVDGKKQFPFRPIGQYSALGSVVMPNQEMVFCLPFAKTIAYELHPTSPNPEVEIRNNTRRFGLEGLPGQVLPDADHLNAIYGDFNKDVRFIRMAAKESGSTNGMYAVTKWYPFNSSRSTNLVPMIRLSEMYLIAAEGALTSEEGMEYINTIWENKRLDYNAANPPVAPDDPSEFRDMILREYVRDFWGEGQIFYCYKRLGVDEITYASMRYYSQHLYPSFGGPLPITFDEYILPVPATEIQPLD
ncbi:RagB/SusD family nutrient uptake outer membrane protein [Alistipes sp. OttesenSCG-928-B03]|nr:RagB/SusD family nutrient uptake outer membrane protein [Alistipes sp. OttesenSCG-928-B03]